MRDMTFKNLTSADRRKRVLWASETIEENGLLTKIHKYLIYIVKETTQDQIRPTPKPEIHVLKCRDTKERTERFHIRMKGSMFCVAQKRTFLVSFCHTLKIDLSQAPTPA